MTSDTLAMGFLVFLAWSAGLLAGVLLVRLFGR